MTLGSCSLGGAVDKLTLLRASDCRMRSRLAESDLDFSFLTALTFKARQRIHASDTPLRHRDTERTRREVSHSLFQPHDLNNLALTDGPHLLELKPNCNTRGTRVFVLVQGEHFVQNRKRA